MLTFALGLALARVSLCAVGAMQELIAARQLSGLLRLLLAASGAGVALLLLAGLAPGRVLLPGESGAYAAAIAGGLLLGVGALINGGCYLGSVLYLGSGNLNFLLTLFGIALGGWFSGYAAAAAMPTISALRMSVGPAWIAGLAGFLLIIVMALSRARSKQRWLAVIAGLLAGLVYARRPGWSYGTVLNALGSKPVPYLQALSMASNTAVKPCVSMRPRAKEGCAVMGCSCGEKTTSCSRIGLNSGLERMPARARASGLVRTVE